MSTYKFQDIFGSGPHRFAIGVQGQSIVPNVLIGGSPPGSTPQGLRELDITVTGRLVAPTEADLWTLRDDITDLLVDPPTVSELTDNHGHTWTDMSFIKFEENDRTDRGRVVSLGYTAVFRRFVV